MSSMLGSASLITGGQFIQNNTTNTYVDFNASIIQGGINTLTRSVAPNAFHDSAKRSGRSKCHPNTHGDVLQRIRGWLDTCDVVIMWLCGPPTTGKSAIAQTFADLCDEEERLLASFFFSEHDRSRSTEKPLVATLAYQLALRLPQVREYIYYSVGIDSYIFQKSTEAQLKALILGPVQKLQERGFFDNSKAPRLIIIDGLNECKTSEAQCDILRSILRDRKSPLLFLISSRIETAISSTFHSEPERWMATTLDYSSPLYSRLLKTHEKVQRSAIIFISFLAVLMILVAMSRFYPSIATVPLLSPAIIPQIPPPIIPRISPPIVPKIPPPVL